MHQDYRIALIRELRDQQVRYAPRAKRLEQAERAERLLGELDAKRQYPYEFIFFRVTDYRPSETVRRMISGQDAAHDLRLFVEDVSDSLDLRLEEANEPVHTVEDLSRMFNVSTKTISRWRDQGLVSRRFVCDGRKRVGFLHSSVERFVSRNIQRVKRGERFSQLTDDERVEIIERSRHLASEGANLSEVARRVAGEVHRSIETVRYTLKNHDRRYPLQAVFPDQRPELTDSDKRSIYQQSLRGATIAQLCKRYGRLRGSIVRILNEQRAQRLMELTLDFIPNEVFTQTNEALVAEILGPTPNPSFHRGR